MSAIDKAFSSALKGIQDGLSSLAGHASRIARFGTSDTSDTNEDSFVSDAVGVEQDIQGIKANATVLKEDQKMEKSILDIIA